MKKQKLLNIIKKSELAAASKKKLTAKVNQKGASAKIVKEILADLEKTKQNLQQKVAKQKAVLAKTETGKTGTQTKQAAEFKAKEIDRLVGEQTRRVNREFVKRTRRLEKMMNRITRQSMKMIEEDKQQEIKDSIKDIN